MRPRFTDAESAGIGLGMPAIAVIACGVGERSYRKPGAADPVIGTEFCGLPRNGVVSFTVSHGSIFGCCLKSVNHEQPVSRTGVTSLSTRVARFPLPAPRFPRLSLTSNLLGSVLL